jgi:hypothetical protein
MILKQKIKYIFSFSRTKDPIYKVVYLFNLNRNDEKIKQPDVVQINIKF